MTGPLLVSIHDVAPATLAESRFWLDALDDRCIPATVLVVPGPWRRPTLVQDEGTVTWLRSATARGHEVALHGWDHGRCPSAGPLRRGAGTVIARGADEFIGLDRPQACARLAAGARVLEEAGLTPSGFTPPGWLASRGTVVAAGELGLRYLASQRAVLDLRRARRHPIVALSNRPGGAGEAVGAQALARVAPLLARRAGVRIALHPDDVHRPRARAGALAAIDAALAARARAMTYHDFVRGRAA
jgi:hypothetical protein